MTLEGIDYTEWLRRISDFDPSEPFVVHRAGGTEFSTSRVLVPGRPSWCWDCNGWYRLLGVSWPYANATRGQLSKHYIAAGGQGDPRKTYVFKQLLDRDVKLAYDKTPLGSMYIHDEAVQEVLRDRIEREVRERRLSGEDVSVSEILQENGFEDLTDTPDEEGVDTPTPVVHDHLAWSYWVWDADPRAQADHEVLLRQWQSVLLDVAREVGFQGKLQIGEHGKIDYPYLVDTKRTTSPIIYIEQNQTDLRRQAIRALAEIIIE